MKDNEKGALIIEATFVFPIMLFILLFLIYMGNMFYMRSQVDTIATQAAIEAAARCADPMLAEVEKTGTVPKVVNDVKPYHSLFQDKSGLEAVQQETKKKLDRLGTGFFAGMGIKQCNVELKYENHIFYSTVTSDIDYKIQFPIRFLGDDEPAILQMHSSSVVPVTDTAEFIQNIDMAVDYMDSTGLSEKLNNMKDKVSKFFKGN